MNTTTKRKLTVEEIEKAGLILADITSASVLKNLVSKWAQETTVILRRELQLDKGILKRAEYIGEKTTELENRNAEIREDLKTLGKVQQLLKQAIKTEENKVKRDQYKKDYDFHKWEIETLKAERKRNNAEIDLLYVGLGQALGSGNDLKNVAVCAIWENWEKVLENMKSKVFEIPTDTEKEQEFYTSVAQTIGNIVVGQEYKTVRKAYKGESKEGNKAIFYRAERDENGEIVKEWQDITVRYASAKAVNQYVNQYRNKLALKTQHIITGTDEEGNELTVQATALETLGGVDSVESQIDFSFLWAKVENLLTARQCEIVRYILKGYSQKEISIALGVKESTINNHMAQIREKAQESNYISMLWFR